MNEKIFFKTRANSRTSIAAVAVDVIKSAAVAVIRPAKSQSLEKNGLGEMGNHTPPYPALTPPLILGVSPNQVSGVPNQVSGNFWDLEVEFD